MKDEKLAHKPNYEIKSYILQNCPEYVQAIKDMRAYQYYDSVWYDREKQAQKERFRQGYEIACQMANCSEMLYDECEKIANADSARRKRLRNRIKNMFAMGDCVFITLTFTDDVLQNTDEKTRRVYVTRFLKEISECYVGNIDFGKQNGREHYHSVVVTDTDDFSSWTSGFYKAEKVRKDDADSARLSKYISKLTNHAIKNTTKRNSLIYSR